MTEAGAHGINERHMQVMQHARETCKTIETARCDEGQAEYAIQHDLQDVELALLVMMSKPPTGVLPKKGRSVSYTCNGPGLALPSKGVGVCWGSVPGAPKGV